MITILVVEDHQHSRNDICEMLEFEGYKSIEAENGQVGLELARQHRPDLILCDTLMPVMDGYQMVEQLQRDPELATIPVIMMTARVRTLTSYPENKPGISSYLTKPFSAQQLLDEIRAKLRRRDS